jgi:hypothetical protein
MMTLPTSREHQSTDQQVWHMPVVSAVEDFGQAAATAATNEAWLALWSNAIDLSCSLGRSGSLSTVNAVLRFHNNTAHFIGLKRNISITR